MMGKSWTYGKMVLTFCLFRSSDVFNIGPGMNNTIGLSKIGRDTRVTICNNNHTIFVYSVPSMKQITALELPSAVNHSKSDSLYLLFL
jgi:hypothetical protein